MRSLPELLESRIAPAGITISHNTASWTDYDGDHVILTWTGGTGKFARQASSPVFDYFTPTDGVPGGIIVSEITFSNPNDHIAVFVKPTRGATGNDHVDLGYINATGIPLASFVAPQASVLEFDCGVANALQPGIGIGTLTLAGYGTQDPETFNASAANILPPGADGIGRIAGSIGAVHITGDIGYGELSLGFDNSKVGPVTVGGNLLGDALVGGFSGYLNVVGKTVTSISIGKNIIGGNDPDIASGFLQVGGSIGAITVGGDIIGGASNSSGALADGETLAHVGTINIGGSVLGSTGGGFVNVTSAKILNVKGNIQGGPANFTGYVEVGSATNINITGSIIGGNITDSSADFYSGLLYARGNVTNISLGHNLVAGSDTGGGSIKFDGAISVDGQLSRLAIGGDILGTNSQRAYILVQGINHPIGQSFYALGTLNIGGDVRYAVIESGQAFSTTIGTAEQPDAGIAEVNIKGDYLHSSIMAGINDNPYSTAAPDGVDVSDSASGNAILGPVVIKGAVLDDSASAGFSGFEANTVQLITIGGIRVFHHGAVPPALDPLNDILILEPQSN